MRHIALATLLVFTPFHVALACTPLSEDEFRETVSDKASVVIVGEVMEYSNTDAQVQQWTQVRVAETLKGTVPSKTANIKNWQASHPPMFTSKKGDRVLLFLMSGGKQLSLTNTLLANCVPAVIPVGKDDKVHPPFTPKDGSLKNRVDVRTLLGYLTRK